MLSDRCLSVSLSVCLSVCGVGVLWPNVWTDQDESWHAGRTRPRRLCVRWGPRFPSPKRGRSYPNLRPFILWPNGRMDQDCSWHGRRPQPRRLYVRWGPSPLPKRGRSPIPNFRSISVVTKWLDASRCHLV